MYTTKLSLTADQATALCTTSQNFTYADSFNSSVALTNVYLYQDGFNSFYYNEFLNVTGMTAEELN